MPEDLLIDTQLINRLKNNDDAALSIIYTKYWQLLYVSSYNILKDKQVCEDIIQELFIKLWNNRHQIEITSSLKAYLYASTRYSVYRQIRAGSVCVEIYPLLERLHTPSTYGNIEYKELLEQVNSVVNRLPEKCKEVYKLSREEHLKHKQIAERLNISAKTVENHLTKALRQLRTSLSATLIAQMVWVFLKN